MVKSMGSAKRNFFAYIAFAILLIIYCIVYYAGLIGQLPSGTHEWAQADRLSLALNFYDNGMDFFHPATHNLESVEGIVGVEFPIQAYIAGGLGYIFGRAQIVMCFRLLDILITCTALLYLFRAIYKKTADFIFSLFVPLFLFCSPVYVYYSGNFLPDAAATSIAIIGLCLFQNYLDHKKIKVLTGSILIVTLATLIKATIVLYLIAIILSAVVLEFKGRDLKWKKRIYHIAGISLISAFLIGINIYYIKHLNQKYHSSLFLAETNSFKSWEQFNDFIEFGFKRRWMTEYFMLAQYPVLVFLISLGIVMILSQKSRRYLFPAFVMIIGIAGMVWLFGGQLLMHDYYILPILFPLIAYLLLISIRAIAAGLSDYHQVKAFRAGLLATVICLFFFADFQLYRKQYFKDNYQSDNFASFWLKDSKHILDSLHIPGNEHVLASEYSPNLALVYSGRKGLSMNPDWSVGNVSAFTVKMYANNIRILIANTNHLDKMKQQNHQDFSEFTILYQSNGLSVLKLTGRH